MDRTLGYWCLCADGYNGTLCETEIDECESNPCINNGTCVNLTPGYSCECLNQFNGENCENLTDICLSSPCQHGGTCKAENFTGNFTCSCGVGFTGVNCEVDIDECASNPCMANAYCMDLVNAYKCECYPSYSGDHCDVCKCHFFYFLRFGSFRGVKDGIATYKWHCSSACKGYETYMSKSPFYSFKRARAMTVYFFLGIESIYIKYVNAFIIIMIIMIKVNIKFSAFLLMPENNHVSEDMVGDLT